MKRRFRLNRSTDYERVRRSGKSYPHPLMVLIVSPGALEQTRVAVAASRAVGGAVQRNRSKRLMRACVDEFFSDLKPGCDIVLVARRPLPEAGFWKARTAIESLFRRAGLLNPAKGQDEQRIPE